MEFCVGLQGFLQEVLWVFEESFNEDGEVFLETFKGASQVFKEVQK